MARMNWTKRGCVEVPGGRVAYGIVGEAERTLLTLHGGPGVPSPYLYSMADLSTDGLRVVFYDQLGCGESDRPDDPSLWVVGRFVEEVEAVRNGLGLGRIDLWGQSWGGMLAQAYALAYPDALRTLCLASTMCSASFHRGELARLIEAFPPEIAAPLRAAFNGGDASSDDYRAASEWFWRRHVCRIPFPPEVQRSVDGTAHAILELMWGPDDVALVGTLSTFEVTDRLAEITVPTLVTVGAYDSMTPASARLIADRIPRSDLVLFEHSSHHAHWEERERYMQVVGDFLRDH
jgi:proline-specific peptidase